MAEAEQPQIDDLKRLLKRLEHAKPDSSDAPQPPPLPNGATPGSKAAESGNPVPAKDIAALSALKAAQGGAMASDREIDRQEREAEAAARKQHTP